MPNELLVCVECKKHICCKKECRKVKKIFKEWDKKRKEKEKNK